MLHVVGHIIHQSAQPPDAALNKITKSLWLFKEQLADLEEQALPISREESEARVISIMCAYLKVKNGKVYDGFEPEYTAW